MTKYLLYTAAMVSLFSARVIASDVAPREFFAKPQKTCRATITMASGTEFWFAQVHQSELPWVEISYRAKKIVGGTRTQHTGHKTPRVWIQVDQVSVIKIESSKIQKGKDNEPTASDQKAKG